MVAKLTIPQNAKEMQEMMDDPKTAAQIIQNGQLSEFVAAYAKATDERGEMADLIRQSVQASMVGQNEITAKVEETVSATVEKLLKEHGVNRPGMGTPQGDGAKHNAMYNPLAPGVALDNLGFVNMGDYLKTAWYKAPASEKRNEITRISNAFSSHEPESGGYLIPETYRSEIMTLALESSVVRPRATVLTMSTPTQLVPFNDATSNASSVYGGFIFYWSDEAADSSANATNAKFGRMKLEVNDLIGYSQVPNELMADAAGLNSWIMQALPRGLGFFEDIAFLNGNGAGQPLGVLNAANTALVTIAKETGQAADTIVTQNILNMFARMLPASLGNAVWVANINTFPQLMQLTINVGTGGAPVMLMDIRNAPDIRLLGRPVVFTEKAASIGDLNDISFVDFSYYMVGDRQAVSLDSSEHVNFATNQTALRIIERVDGRPWLQSAITPYKGSSLSPFINLAAR